MTPRISGKFSTSLIDWSSFVVTGNTIPPRDHPDEDDDDDDDEDEEEEERADEPPVVLSLIEDQSMIPRAKAAKV